MNSQCSFIETLKYSKAHDTWASDKEFEHLHRLLAPKSITPPQAKQTPPIIKQTAKAVTGRRTENKFEYDNDEKQKILRTKVAQLLRDNRNSHFFQSLANWRYKYTWKQASTIERIFKEEYGDRVETVRSTPQSNSSSSDEDRWTTDEEENDPNWTPWD